MAKKVIRQTEKIVPLVAPVDVDRITQVIHFHHEHRGDNPTSIEVVSSKIPETREQPWSRRIKVSQDRIKLVDIKGCWLEPHQIGFIAVENLSGKFSLVQPSEEERKATADKILELTLDCMCPESQASWLIGPGWPFIACPKFAGDVWLQCQSGEADVRITLFPK